MRVWLRTIALATVLLGVAPAPVPSAPPAPAPVTPAPAAPAPKGSTNAAQAPAAQAPAAPAPQPKIARPAPPALIAELRPIVESARQRFEARDAAGVLTNVSDQYRSSGLTKTGLREQLLSMFALYDTMRVRLSIDRVDLVDGAVWVYTSGEVTGRLPLLGWMRVLAWQGQPEVARREGAVWRLFGFQD